MSGETAEAKTLQAFIASPRRRDRLIGVLTTKKRYTELDRGLSHEDLWDSRYVKRLAAAEQNSRSVASRLREYRAPARCHVLGGIRDGEDMDLDDALRAIVGTLDACLVICIPGHLAYHESEEPTRRVLLVRQAETNP